MNTHRVIRSLLWTVGMLAATCLPSTAQFVQQGSKLFGTGGVGSAYQGTAVSISADGNTAIVGGPYDDSNTGAVWVHTRTGSVWSQQGGKLVGTGGVGAQTQGYAVSISADGNTALIGGYNDNFNNGAAWIFTRSGGVWSQQGGKLIGTGAVGVVAQGYSVSLSGDGNTAIVGGPWDNGNTGAAWVYTRSGGVWSQQGGKLVGTGAVGGAQEGYSVSLSADGNTAIMGGFYDNTGAGAAWIFTRSGGVWSQQGGKLVGTGGVGTPEQGYSVSLAADGNTAIVGGDFDNGAMGAAWVYTRSGGAWSQQGGKLVGTGALGVSHQGESVALSSDGNTAIVGGSSDNAAQGATWVYTRSGGVWSQQGGKLVGTGAISNPYQGWAVALSGDASTAIVGGFFDNLGGGAAWVFYGPRQAVISAVEDIPEDQGGQVSLSWASSPYDEISMSPQVTSYSIFRKGSPVSMTAHMAPATPDRLMSDSSLLGYQYVADVPALQLSEYETVVPTLEDSSASGTPYFNFLVVARTEDIDQYFVSGADSGYSVDNLSPIPPGGLLATVQAGPQVSLTWNAPTDPDVKYYTIYRSTTNGFTPGPGDNIGTSNAMSYVDTGPLEGVPSYYRIVATDVHDNESAPSGQAGAAVTINAQFGVQEKWNIVSVPLQMADYTKTALFPTATTPAYAYDEGYFGYATLESGRGYWLKFTGSETISHDGLERTEDTMSVQQGWNMVGSLSSSIPISNVGSIPGGIVTSNFYAYEGAYVSSPSLEPGKGYWVKVSQAGQLVLSGASAVPSNRIRIEDTGELPPPPPDGVNSVLPDVYALEQNYPNPFNPVTSIRYALPSSEHVTITVFNSLGQDVAVLVDERQEPGEKIISFDAGDLPSGVYTYRIVAGEFVDVKRMVLLK